MEKYEKSIGLKTIWLTLLRRFHIILLIFIPITLISVVYSYAFIKTEYTNSITLSTSDGSGYTVAKYGSALAAIKSLDNAQLAAENLAAITEERTEPIKHKDGSAITATEIYSGITMAASVSSTVASFNVTFKTSDDSISQVVLKEVIKAAETKIKAAAPKMQYGEPSKPTDNSKDKMKYMLIGTAAGLVLGLGFAFVYEIVSDEVRDKGDIENLGSAGFELTASK